MIYERMHRIVDDDTKVKQKIVSALYRHVIGDATGSSREPYERYPDEDPRSLFWLGSLVPDADIETPERPDAFERLMPASQGFSFCVSSLPINLNITVSFSLWVTLHPTYQEQVASVSISEETKTEEKNNNREDISLEMAHVWTKVPVKGVELQTEIVSDDLVRMEPRHIGREDISEAITRALNNIPKGFTLHRPLRRPGGSRPRQSDLIDKVAWATWERANLEDPVCPKWIVESDIEVRSLSEGLYEVMVTIVNRSPSIDTQFIDRDNAHGFDKWACHPEIYECTMRVDRPRSVVPYKLDQIPDSYRYDRNVDVLGWNCATKSIADGFETDFATIASTERVWPRENVLDGNNRLDTRFRKLADDPLPALENILTEAEMWVDLAWGPETLKALANQYGWDNNIMGQVWNDADEVRKEIEWVRSGVKHLKNNKNMLRAFCLMNETMVKVAGDRYQAWHPFQIAFILGCLPTLLNSEDDDIVDILWFPTGGGKTEAYLGLSALSLFYGRLTGRGSGCQIWARFPLRLLSLQQTQRFAELVLMAESVRLEQDDIREGNSFGIGYLVGTGNTPNRIYLPDSRFYKGWDPFSDSNTEACRVLERCPLCAQRPNVEFNRKSYTMEHKCETSSCVLFGRLPIYVIDDDIERWTPSVIVGTVDKLTKISWSNGFRHLLGISYGYCNVHGLSRYRGRCAIWPCDNDLNQIPSGFSGLQIEIQDEMHLLSESLGALDGNYETLFQSIASECGIDNLKIIGATATIEGYKEQSVHLYKKQPRRFPLPGPTRYESFWAFENENDPLRSYVALLPRGITLLDAAFRITRSFRQLLDQSLEDTKWFCSFAGIDVFLDSKVRKWLTYYYYIFTTYALRKNELTRYQSDIMDSPTICSGESWESITGDINFWDVRDILRRLEKSDDDEQPLRILGATSAISHGVDVARLNVMCVMGMPNQVSEFIQATSRVGRVHPGLVFCLINSLRERDVSNYRYFRKWIDYLDRLVEHVPVNRESLQVLERVLSGGFMAWILQVLEPNWLRGEANKDRKRLWYVSELGKAIEFGDFDEEDIIRYLLKAFAIDTNNPRFDRHQILAKEFVERVFREIKTSQNTEGSVADLLTTLGYPVPRSLRDVDSLIDIRGDW